MIPVVYIHTGQSDYLDLAVKKARQTNTVVLLSDSGGGLSISEYQKTKGIYDFALSYKHMSTNGEDFELFCLTRWFVLLDYMAKTGTDIVFYADSDVLVYDDINKYYAPFKDYEFTLLRGRSGGEGYFTLEGVGNYCKFITAAYRDKNENYIAAKKHWEALQEAGKPGGVNDMTFFELYSIKNFHKIGELTNIYNGATFDPNINMGNGYEIVDGHKKVFFYNNMPYCYSTVVDSLVKFITLHFQGADKSAMYQCGGGK